MPEVEYHIGFRQTERISSRVGPLLQDFVAHTPHEDGRVIAVPHYHIGEIPLVPLVEETGIVVFSLASAPHVERLVHHYESHPVAQIKELGSRRVVGGADTVASHFLEYLKLPPDSPRVYGRPETSKIMVHAYTVDFHMFTVKEEAFVRVEAE